MEVTSLEFFVKFQKMFLKGDKIKSWILLVTNNLHLFLCASHIS